MTSISSLDEFSCLLSDLPGPDRAAAEAWAARDPKLTKPPGALGRLEEMSLFLASWQGRHPPRLDHVAARIFAGNHGVAARGVSAFPASVTAQMVENFQRGGAAVNQLCATFGIALEVLPLALDQPTEDFTQGPAMSEADYVAALNVGMASIAPGMDLLCLGEMGIGNTSSAAALACALFGGEAADWTGPGTGVSGTALNHKAAIIGEGVALHAGGTPLNLLKRLGGRELAAMAGAVLAARLAKIPVMLDGYVTCAAAAVLEAARPGALDHCVIGHVSAEPGHRKLVERLGKRPLLDLDMRLGEASGAVLAVGILKGAIACHNGMATFDEAGVSGKA